MFLEEWVHDRINADGEFGQYIENGTLDKGTRKAVEAFQLFRLKKILTYAYENSTFYKNVFDLKDFNAEEIKSLDDLARLPLTRGEDIREGPYRFACVPLGDIARVFSFATSGSTGAPKKVFFNEEDIETTTDTMAGIMKTAITCAGIDATGSVVYILMPNGSPMSQAGLIGRGVEKMGGNPVIGDIKSDSESQIAVIEDARPVMIMASAFRMHRLTQEARESHDLREMGTKVLFVTSEYLSNPMRRNLEGFWGGEVYHHYGMTETGLAAAIECQFHNGFHFDETNFLFEVVNPETGEVLKDGKEGEIVFTALQREGMSLIRYRTGDMGSMTHEPCECGAFTLARINRITKRVKAIVRVGKGDEIYPSMFDDVMYHFPGIVDYKLTIADDSGGDAITVDAEVIEESDTLEQEVTKSLVEIPLISKNIKAGYLTHPEVKFLGKKSLTRQGRAKRFIIDNRSDKRGRN